MDTLNKPKGFKIESLTSKKYLPRGQLNATYSQRYRSLWRLHYCYSKDEFTKSEIMFVRKIKSVFPKLIPRQAKFKKTVSPHKKHFYPGNKVPFKAYKNNMTFWELGTVKQRIGELVYIVQGPKTPTNAIWTSSGNAVWINLRNHHKIPAKSRSTQYSIVSIWIRLKSLRKYDAREEKENLRNHST